jgi:hypothetical protein
MAKTKKSVGLVQKVAVPGIVIGGIFTMVMAYLLTQYRMNIVAPHASNDTCALGISISVPADNTPTPTPTTYQQPTNTPIVPTTVIPSVSGCNLILNQTASVNAGKVTYTLSYRNNGTGECTGGGVKLRDVVDDTRLDVKNITHTESSPQSDPACTSTSFKCQTASYMGYYTDYNVKTIIWNVHELPPNMTKDMTVSWTAPLLKVANCSGNQTVNNQAYIISRQYDTNVNDFYSGFTRFGAVGAPDPTTHIWNAAAKTGWMPGNLVSTGYDCAVATAVAAATTPAQSVKFSANGFSNIKAVNFSDRTAATQIGGNMQVSGTSGTTLKVSTQQVSPVVGAKTQILNVKMDGTTKTLPVTVNWPGIRSGAPTEVDVWVEQFDSTGKLIGTSSRVGSIMYGDPRLRRGTL